MEFMTSSFQSEINGYQKSPYCQGYSDKAKMISKLMISGTGYELGKLSKLFSCGITVCINGHNLNNLSRIKENIPKPYQNRPNLP